MFDLHQIIFNTDEDLDLFIPYNTYSMLAITKESAYQICFIKDSSGNCISECSSNNIILDIDGNKCADECDDNQYLIVPEGVCSKECNTSIYIISGKNCGLCRDVNNTNQYKIINSTECLSEKRLPWRL